jgi:ribosomal protein L16 Arg81 hydroxylase
LRGQKLWLYARPEQREEFMKAFPAEASIAWSHLNAGDVTKKQPIPLRDLIDKHQFGLIHHQPGQMFHLPAGWPHAVYNLTDSTMISISVLHPWNVPTFIDEIRTGETNAAEVIDPLEIMRTFTRHSTSVGVSKAVAKRQLEEMEQVMQDRAAMEE